MLGAAACGSDSRRRRARPPRRRPPPRRPPPPAATTTAGAATTAGSTPGTGGVTAEGISDEECAANKAAGKITYLSSFDFSASASIVDVVVAKEKGYFDTMCLDVDLKPGFSTTNYPLIAGNQAQFSSAGNFTEILNYSNGGAEYVALVNYGKVPIEGAGHQGPDDHRPRPAEGQDDRREGRHPPSIVAMLAKAGLKRGTDYKEVLLDGFDPVAQLKLDIDALPVYKSNEPGQLDAAGVKYAPVRPGRHGHARARSG